MVMINIQKKDLFLVLAIVVFMTGVGIIIAYNPTGTGGTPSIMGHSIDEISLPACTDGQILKKSGSNWVCSNEASADLSTYAKTTALSGGLYGSCIGNPSGCNCNIYPNPTYLKSPAICTQVNSAMCCRCLPGYTSIKIGEISGSPFSTGSSIYSCYKN